MELTEKEAEAANERAAQAEHTDAAQEELAGQIAALQAELSTKEQGFQAQIKDLEAEVSGNLLGSRSAEIDLCV